MPIAKCPLMGGCGDWIQLTSDNGWKTLSRRCDGAGGSQENPSNPLRATGADALTILVEEANNPKRSHLYPPSLRQGGPQRAAN